MSDNLSMTCLIPNTSRKNYLTGYTALNIHSSEGTGDWHTLSVFKGTQGRKPGTFFIADDNFPSSREWLGDDELFDCRSFLESLKVPLPEGKVWVATHYRALVDYVLYLVKNSLDIGFHIQLDDWFPELQEKERCYMLLKRIYASGGFTPQEWNLVVKWINLELNSTG